MTESPSPHDFRNLVKNVRQAFQAQIDTSYRCHDCSLDSELTHSGQLEDEDTRFLLWAGNFGALQDSDELNSLTDYLHDSSEVVIHIRDILNEIRDLLQPGMLTSRSA